MEPIRTEMEPSQKQLELIISWCY